MATDRSPITMLQTWTNRLAAGQALKVGDFLDQMKQITLSNAGSADECRDVALLWAKVSPRIDDVFDPPPRDGTAAREICDELITYIQTKLNTIYNKYDSILARPAGAGHPAYNDLSRRPSGNGGGGGGGIVNSKDRPPIAYEGAPQQEGAVPQQPVAYRTNPQPVAYRSYPPQQLPRSNSSQRHQQQQTTAVASAPTATNSRPIQQDGRPQPQQAYSNGNRPLPPLVGLPPGPAATWAYKNRAGPQ